MPTRRAALATAAVVAVAGPAAAAFTATVFNGSGLVVTTGGLSAPTGLGASSTCVAAIQARISLKWSATPSQWATGYVIRRRVLLGVYTTVGTVSGRNTTKFTDNAIALGTTYEYVVQAAYQNWTKDSAPVSVTTPTLC